MRRRSFVRSMLFALSATALPSVRLPGISDVREAAPVKVLANAWKEATAFISTEDPFPAAHVTIGHGSSVADLFDDPWTKTVAGDLERVIKEALPLGRFSPDLRAKGGVLDLEDRSGVRVTTNYDPCRGGFMMTVDAVGPDPENVVEVSDAPDELAFGMM